MKVKYHFGFNSQKHPELLEYLEVHGVKFKTTMLPNGALITFKAFESEPCWEHISQYIELVSVTSSIEYSQKEMQQSRWYRVYSTNRIGYPQPEDLWYSTRFTHKKYDFDSGICSEQLHPFEMKSDPKTRQHFMALFWTEELFVKKTVIKTLREAGIVGWQAWPVKITQEQQPSQTINQLQVDTILSFDAVMSRHERYTTSSGFEKFVRNSKAPLEYPDSLLTVEKDMVLSREIFGDARFASRAILVSKRFYGVYKLNKWKGLKFEPVQISDQ